MGGSVVSFIEVFKITWVLWGVPKGWGEEGTPHPKEGVERVWVLVADWSRGSIKMARVVRDVCVFCHDALQESGETECAAKKKMARKEVCWRLACGVDPADQC